MDEMAALRGRLDALEFVLITVIADALSAQPDIGGALRRFQGFYAQKAAQLRAGADGTAFVDGLQATAFADALIERTNEIARTTLTISGGTGQAS